MQIGPYKLKNNLILAPMAGVTDLPFRKLCRKLGAGMAVSEMVSSNSMLWCSQKTLRRANHHGETEPKSIQIAGSDPQLMADAAKHNVERGAQIIDINMGCPAKKICNVMAGSALLKDELLVRKILKTVVKTVDVPVTLKIRTGWDKTQKNGLRIAKIAEESGIQALAVHGRTRACGYRGDAEYDLIAEIKSQVSIPVIANGDINTPKKAKQVLEYTGVDALMIGRAAQGKPWIFNTIHQYLKSGITPEEPSIPEIREILTGHLQALYKFYGETTGVLVARKHIAWYSKGQRSGAVFRQAANCAKSKEEQMNIVNNFFDQLIKEVEIAA